MSAYLCILLDTETEKVISVGIYSGSPASLTACVGTCYTQMMEIEGDNFSRPRKQMLGVLQMFPNIYGWLYKYFPGDLKLKEE